MATESSHATTKTQINSKYINFFLNDLHLEPNSISRVDAKYVCRVEIHPVQTQQ